MYQKSLKSILSGISFLFLISIFSATTLFAHITLLEPNSGDEISGGSTFTIKWEIDETVAPDENWDIRFTSDNGTNWDVVTKNLTSTVREFNWQVPNINTTQAKIEVIQDLPDGEDDGARSGTFTITKTKSFSFNCETNLTNWVAGLEKLTMDQGENQSCTLKLTHVEPGSPVEISTNTRKGLRSTIEVFPTKGVTDENGELTFSITGFNRGMDWVSWAVPNSNGKFEFTKESYDNGKAWGMFVEIK